MGKWVVMGVKKNWIVYHVGEYNYSYNMADRKGSEERELRFRSARSEVRSFKIRMNGSWVPTETYCFGGLGTS